MAAAEFEPYCPEVEQQMWNFFRSLSLSLSEKDQRRYAALPAVQLGRGGIEQVAGVLECSTRTISRGIGDLEQLPDDPAAGRVRWPGGDRKEICGKACRSRTSKWRIPETQPLRLRISREYRKLQQQTWQCESAAIAMPVLV